MSKLAEKELALEVLRQTEQPLSLREMRTRLGNEVAERSLRRWLGAWCEQGVAAKVGNGPSTRYRALVYAPSSLEGARRVELGFLRGLDEDLRQGVLAQLRDLWTHHSTAIEGNTLTLGDTHFILQEGLTVSGKSLREHEEVLGHARAIEIIYRSLSAPIDDELLFELHLAVQTERLTDTQQPNGAYKRSRNGVYVVDAQGQQRYREFASPLSVPALMREWIESTRRLQSKSISLKNAHKIYAKLHIGFVHIHPFWDGNGRLARLVSNIPLLRAGLPPLVVPSNDRRRYIETLSAYEIAIGKLTSETGVWPKPALLRPFEKHCAEYYNATRQLIEAARATQTTRENAQKTV